MNILSAKSHNKNFFLLPKVSVSLFIPFSDLLLNLVRWVWGNSLVPLSGHNYTLPTSQPLIPYRNNL